MGLDGQGRIDVETEKVKMSQSFVEEKREKVVFFLIFIIYINTHFMDIQFHWMLSVSR